ncbi:protein suppressor of underreplication [Musca vetustissima]|uniref:protein suppressor of underreplication n=1 Tax=Musca vetustissima TaxID=27455 RepID=UPI002AB71DEF|nr:protein suppressor of underreplication [Musca vetustissima]
MFHFVADHPPVPVRLSFRAQILGHVRQYLKQFQVDAIQFMHNFLAKGEFCCYNDESGLGKQAAVAVLLDSACGNKKSLIVVQNDDIYIHGWEFHFSVLTNCSVTVIKDNKDTTDSPHNIYLAKWSTLRNIDDLSKFDFDYIILDNRGQMLNNTFCMSMLLKHYERKINILISSVDITGDLKLLHNILKLGGRLEPRYANFKHFEEKFKLPDAKELTYKKVDLEEYFLKRERLADYCKNFRLRRYCHQYEQHLPLVTPDRYKINLDVFREKQNSTNSENSSVEISSQNRQDDRVRDTQELFEEYCRQRRKQQELQKQKLLEQQKKEQAKLQQQKLNDEKEKEREREREREKEKQLESASDVDDEVAFINYSPPPPIVHDKQPPATRDNTDEVIMMSPLLLVSDSEDTEDVPEICNDPSDEANIVDLSTEDDDNEKPDERTSMRTEDDDSNETNEDVTTRKTVGDNENEDNDETSKTQNGNNEHEKTSNDRTTPTKTVKRHKNVRNEIDRLKADVATNLKFQNETTPKRRTRHADDNHCKRLKNDGEGATTPKQRAMETGGTKERSSSSEKKKQEVTDRENHRKESSTKDAGGKSNDKDKSSKTSSGNNSTPRTSRSIRKIDLTSDNNSSTETPTPGRGRTKKNLTARNNSPHGANKTANALDPNIVIKTEPEDNTPQTKTPTTSSASSTKKTALTKEMTATLERIKRELDVDRVVIYTRDTRSAKRTTRSAGCPSGYEAKNSLFHNDKPNKTKKTSHDKHDKTTNAPKTNTPAKNTKVNEKDTIVDTQAPIISMTCSQDFDPLQCAQRLSSVCAASESNSDVQRKSSSFLVPPTPVSARNSLIPSSINSFFGDSEVVFVPPTPPASTTKAKKNDVIVLSESEENEPLSSSLQSTATSRRTRALKSKKVQNKADEESTAAASKVPTFSQLLAQHNTRASAKSPDLFSNCSDLAPLPCSQNANINDEPSAPFEGFKIFGSEVKQLQQHYATSTTQNSSKGKGKSHRDRSCLDILENMLEPPNKKQKTKSTNDSESAASAKSSSTTQPLRSNAQKTKVQAPIVPHHPIEAIAEAKAQQERRIRSLAPSSVNEDEIFEITNNGTFGSVLRLHSNGEISPVHQTQKPQTQNNKITKYFQGGLTQNVVTSSQEDSGNNSEAGTPSKRHQQHQQHNPQQMTSTQYANLKKSPKQRCPTTTQATKLTKWFTTNNHLDKEIQTQVSKIIGTSLSGAVKQASKRRRRLDLTQVTNDSD